MSRLKCGTLVAINVALEAPELVSKAVADSFEGEDWESVVDSDTLAIIQHEKHIGKFFHRNSQGFVPDILMTGSKKTSFLMFRSDYLENVYGKMLKNRAWKNAFI